MYRYFSIASKDAGFIVRHYQEIIVAVKSAGCCDAGRMIKIQVLAEDAAQLLEYKENRSTIYGDRFVGFRELGCDEVQDFLIAIAPKDEPEYVPDVSLALYRTTVFQALKAKQHICAKNPFPGTSRRQRERVVSDCWKATKG